MPLEEETPSERALLLTLKLGYLSFPGQNDTSCARLNTSAGSGKDLFAPGTKFTGLDIESADVTDLAGVNGVQVTGRRSSLPTIERNPFEITSLIVTFRQRRVITTATRFGGGGGTNYHSERHSSQTQQQRPYARSTTVEDLSYEKA